MKKAKKRRTVGDYSVLALLLLCIIFAAAITGMRIASKRQEEPSEQFVELEKFQERTEETPSKDPEESESRQTAGEHVVNGKEAEETGEENGKENGKEMDMIAAEDQETVILEAEKEEDTPTALPSNAGVSETVSALSFESGDRLSWPVNGNVILDYSMDAGIYFPTLKQYKYNPAIVISAEEGSEVRAGEDGKVLSVTQNEETGMTVMLDFGNGYTGVYGQLKDIPVKEGDRVKADDVIGYIGSPSKYYSIEGSNLYFELRKDGEALDPLDYLE